MVHGMIVKSFEGVDLDLDTLSSLDLLHLCGLESCEDKLYVAGVLKVPFADPVLRYRCEKGTCDVALVRQSLLDEASSDDAPALQAYSFCIPFDVEGSLKARFDIACAAGTQRLEIHWGGSLDKKTRRRRRGPFCLGIVDTHRNLKIVRLTGLDAEPDSFSWPDEDAREKARAICAAYPVSAEECFEHQLFKLDDDACRARCLRLAKVRGINEGILSRLVDVSGYSRGELARRKALASAIRGRVVTMRMMEAYGLWHVDEAALPAFFARFKEGEALRTEVSALGTALRDGGESAEACEETYGRLMASRGGLLDESYLDRIGALLADTVSNVSERRRLAVDMACTREAFGYLEYEYASYRFEEKDLGERLCYLSRDGRQEVFDAMNSPAGKKILRNKGQTFHLLGRWYRRDSVVVSSVADADAFARFAGVHKDFIVKPLSLSSGKGVSIEHAGLLGKKKLCQELLERDGAFIAEELVVQHESLAAFNASSVNTVRVMTVDDGGVCRIGRTFIRFGRAGSVVDNAGQGGIFVRVDWETGRLCGAGFDELRGVFEIHPDSGVPFDGFELPNWQQALALAREVFNQVPGAHCIGWDFACCADGTWCVIEANDAPMFVAPQITAGRGLRKEFLEFTGQVG